MPHTLHLHIFSTLPLHRTDGPSSAHQLLPPAHRCLRRHAHTCQPPPFLVRLATAVTASAKGFPNTQSLHLLHAPHLQHNSSDRYSSRTAASDTFTHSTTGTHPLSRPPTTLLSSHINTLPSSLHMSLHLRATHNHVFPPNASLPKWQKAYPPNPTHATFTCTFQIYRCNTYCRRCCTSCPNFVSYRHRLFLLHTIPQ